MKHPCLKHRRIVLAFGLHLSHQSLNLSLLSGLGWQIPTHLDLSLEIVNHLLAFVSEDLACYHSIAHFSDLCHEC